MKPQRFFRSAAAGLFAAALTAAVPELRAREWRFTGIADPLEAELVGMGHGGVVLRGANGKSFEVPLASFSEADREYLRLLSSGKSASGIGAAGKPIVSPGGYATRSVATISRQIVKLRSASELHLTGEGDPCPGCTFDFTAPDGWLFFDNIKPSVVAEKFLERMLVSGKKAEPDRNVRIVQYGQGTVVIPQPPDFPALKVFAGKDLSGASVELACYGNHGEKDLESGAASLVLRRGYMATLAAKADGTGASVNYVAQDHDVVIDALPAGLRDGVRFVRVFPWRWVGKKGIAGGVWKDLKVDWFYDWNISSNSTADVAYVPIRQNRYWPGLDQDWKARGSLNLLGFNEPDHKDQSNMSVADALAAWPDLLKTGLRLGSPAPSDGGLGWLYEFVDKADKAGLRVDFVAVHYYRSVADPGDAKGAADQFSRFLKGVHDRVKRPIWITEWNNGANWTKDPDPNDKQQKAAVAAMIAMLDKTPYVERYALYNWVEASRELVRKDGSLTPAGEAYRDDRAPLAFTQPKGK